jgi:hypothetical protein
MGTGSYTFEITYKLEGWDEIRWDEIGLDKIGGMRGTGCIVSHLEESFLHCRGLIAVLGDVVHHVHYIEGRVGTKEMAIGY